MAAPAPRHVVITAFPGVQVLDLVGPHEVFTLANRFGAASGREGRTETFDPAETADPARPPRLAYRIDVRTPTGEAVATSSGLSFAPDGALGRPTAKGNGAIHTLVVPGGDGTVEAADDLVPWLAAVGPRCERITSVCSGALLLAGAGLLDGRRATTHWSLCDFMAEQFPAVAVEADPIFVRDGNTWTSAGITAGIDLALALVEDDLGPDVSRRIARQLVMFVQRPGGQAQFSAHLAAPPAQRPPLRDLQGWIADHVDADLSVAALAERVHMSVRHFSRVFRDEVGVTPADYVERARVEAARNLLEATREPVEHVARRCGFGTPETLQRSFRRVVGVTPSDYRRHFNRRPA